MSLIHWLKTGNSLEGLSSAPRGYVMAEPLRFGRHVLGAPAEKVRVGFWESIFSGWLNWRGALVDTKAQSARPRVRSTIMPMQSELMLGSVTVVRNDLSGSDLEVLVGNEMPSRGSAVKPARAATRELASVN